MAYVTQTFENNKTVLKAEHLQHIEQGIVNLEKSIPTDSSNYWAGKKFVMNGDSIPYGSALSSVKNAFPYLVADQLGMELTNYSIGGTVIAKHSGDYDECYTSTSQWEADLAAGTLDTSKKYLVNTGKNAPRIYQIYSYNGSTWVGGGTASTSAGRTPLSDRIGAMDTDADVIMIMAGSNDFYYNWNLFGNFEDGKYRARGYTGDKETGVEIGEIDTTTNLLDAEGIEFVSAGAITASSSEVDTSYTEYFTYRNIPVKGNRAIQVANARRGWWLDADGDDISQVNFTNDVTNFTAIAPADAAYLTVCFKYEEATPESCTVYMSLAVDNEGDGTSSGKASAEPNETFCDGLHKLCRYLCNTYKNKDIIFLTPIKRRQYTGLSNGTWDCVYPEDTNAEGKTIKDYRDAIIEACEYYSIPYIDMYTISGLNPHIDMGMFADTDGKATHPSNEGHARMASQIVAYLQSLRK